MTDYRKPDAYWPPQFPATDIVERWRADAANCGAAYAKGTSNGLLLMRCQENCAAAADKIDVQRSQIKWQAERISALEQELAEGCIDGEFVRLREENAILMGNTNAAIEDYNDCLAENAKLREALEMIAGTRQCLDNLMSDKEIARGALQKDQGEDG